jgi:hypothetical protein
LSWRYLLLPKLEFLIAVVRQQVKNIGILPYENNQCKYKNLVSISLNDQCNLAFVQLTQTRIQLIDTNTK